MSEQTWVETRLMKPREGIVVDTISDSGIQRLLKRSGNLWFHDDGEMYVYYTPKFWRPQPKGTPND